MATIAAGSDTAASCPATTPGRTTFRRKDSTFVIMVNSDIATDGVNPAPALFKALAKIVTPENVPE